MLNELTTLIAPLEPASANIDWPHVEAALGIRLPADYRGLYEAYGDGSFNGYLWFLSPTSDENIGIVEQSEEMRWMLAELKEDDPAMIAYDVSSGSRQLLGCATTIDGDMIFWLTSTSEDPNEWPIRICDPGGWDWEEFDGGLVDYLYGLHSGSVESGILADDITEKPHQFVRHGELPA